MRRKPALEILPFPLAFFVLSSFSPLFSPKILAGVGTTENRGQNSRRAVNQSKGRPGTILASQATNFDAASSVCTHQSFALR